jgi:hypothetical protein
MNQRAKRYEVALPVRYRSAGDDACYAGSTKNISVSGLLFTITGLIPVGTSIEAWVELRHEKNGGNHAVLYCAGNVVRQAMSDEMRPTAAMSIARWRVVPVTPDFQNVESARKDMRNAASAD